MKRSKLCPKCSSTELITWTGGTCEEPAEELTSLLPAWMPPAGCRRFLCLGCGLLETYCENPVGFAEALEGIAGKSLRVNPESGPYR